MMDPVLLADDLSDALRALPGAVTVSFGAATVDGNLQRRSEQYQDGEGRIKTAGERVELRILRGSLPGLAHGSLLTTAPPAPYSGTPETWKVRDDAEESCGLTVLLLLKA